MATPPLFPLATRISTSIQFSHQFNTTLNHDNFLVWRSQILLVLRGHSLVGFIDGTKSSPPQFITDSDGAQSINPDYEIWHQQDQLILAWIFNSVSFPLLAQVVRCETTASIWNALNQVHSSQSMAKILDLKLQLQTMKNRGLSCSQYLQQMQIVADRLRSIGTEVFDQDLVLYALQGLGSEFQSFVTALSIRSDYPSMVEFTGLLLAHEADC
jgi:gag-polypeptide of LTR copia-type